MIQFNLSFSLFCVFVATLHQCISKRPECEKYIDFINKHQSTWIAGKNVEKHSSITRHTRKNSTMTVRSEFHPLELSLSQRRRHKPAVIAKLPEHFDARAKWSYCLTVNEIRNQGNCDSCWAVSAVGVMTDRVCIYSNGTKHFNFSAEDLVSCSRCGGCEGCPMSKAWKYWRNHGIVSGGGYNSRQGCRPYSIPDVKNRENSTHTYPTPKCIRSCQEGYNTTYAKDKRFGKKVYYVVGEDQIKAEIYVNGPVQGGYQVFEDFFCYKSGVYRNIRGSGKYYHAVKIIGWGIDNGTKYWLAVNSWDTHWGDKGFFKILRGENHCDIESYVAAGVPAL